MDEAASRVSSLDWMTASGIESSLWYPERLVAPNSWVAHIPFAFWLMEHLKPRQLVELGVHSGNSYAAFCQAVRQLGLPTRCFGVDTWDGDPHAGFYGEDVFEALSRWHDARYANFSRLVRAKFDDAASHFAEGSIDLLHIDGMHSYEAVRHDFLTWKPLLSRSAIVLFHDTNVRENDFGVWRFWAELARDHASFEFLHGHGLGVLAVGPDLPEALGDLFAMAGEPEGLARLRTTFARLGEPLMRDILLNDARHATAQSEAARQAMAVQLQATEQERAQSEAARQAMAAQLQATEEAERQAIERLDARLATEQEHARRFARRLDEAEQASSEAIAQRDATQTQLEGILNSTSWRTTSHLRKRLNRHPALRRLLRRSARLTWWIVTLQAPRRLRSYWEARRSGHPMRRPMSALPEDGLFRVPAALPAAEPTVSVKLLPVPLPIDASAPRPVTPRGTLLCLSHVAPYPPRAGNEYRMHRLLSWLREEGWQVILLYCPLPDNEPSDEQVRLLSSAYANLVVVGRDGRLQHGLSDPIAAAAIARLKGQSRDVSTLLGEDGQTEAARLLGLVRVFCPDALVEVLLALDQALQPRAVLASYVFMTRGLPLLRQGTLKIVDTHDVFSTKAEKVSAFGIRDDLAMSAAEEGALLGRADVALGIQPEESEALRRIAPGVDVHTIGVDITMPAQSPPVAAPVLLLVASANPMNIKGLRDFLRFAWPRIIAAVPEARLDVVGTVGEAVPDPVAGLRLLGRIDDLEAAYATARIVINPAVAGTGLKIKTLEALANLKPIVVWPSGVDGIAPELRVFCTVVTDWYAFGEAALRLLHDAAPGRDLHRSRADIARLLSAETAYGSLRRVLLSDPR